MLVCTPDNWQWVLLIICVYVIYYIGAKRRRKPTENKINVFLSFSNGHNSAAVYRNGSGYPHLPIRVHRYCNHNSSIQTLVLYPYLVRVDCVRFDLIVTVHIHRTVEQQQKQQSPHRCAALDNINAYRKTKIFSWSFNLVRYRPKKAIHSLNEESKFRQFFFFSFLFSSIRSIWKRRPNNQQKFEKYFSIFSFFIFFLPQLGNFRILWFVCIFCYRLFPVVVVFFHSGEFEFYVTQPTTSVN